jgi:hypothetical protein
MLFGPGVQVRIDPRTSLGCYWASTLPPRKSAASRQPRPCSEANRCYLGFDTSKSARNSISNPHVYFSREIYRFTYIRSKEGRPNDRRPNDRRPKDKRSNDKRSNDKRSNDRTSKDKRTKNTEHRMTECRIGPNVENDQNFYTIKNC